MAEYSRSFDQPCPQCKQMTISCVFDDGLPCGGADPTFVFEHRCSDCGYHETVSHYICDGYDTRDDYGCDFCGWNWLPQLS